MPAEDEKETSKPVDPNTRERVRSLRRELLEELDDLRDRAQTMEAGLERLEEVVHELLFEIWASDR